MWDGWNNVIFSRSSILDYNGNCNHSRLVNDENDCPIKINVGYSKAFQNKNPPKSPGLTRGLPAIYKIIADS